MTQTRTNATYSVYNHDAIMHVGQFLRESERDDLVDMAQEDCIVAAARWFLDRHGRWSRAYIRRTAAAFGQQIEQLGQCELIPSSQARALLDALKNARPLSKPQSRRSAKDAKLADLFRRQSERDDLADMAEEDFLVAAAQWFLNGHGRWPQAFIRSTATALSNQIERLGKSGLIPPSQARALLDALKNARPQSKRQRRRSAKSVKLAELRRLIGFFRGHKDRLNVWIAGYLQIASRLGWRPGEMLSVWINGNYLCAFAEKHTNARGLCDICEIGLHEFPRRLIEKLAAWISETGKLADENGGRWKLRDLVKKRIARACKKFGIRPISLYTLRHVAIASMKKSGFTPKEIAAIINHKCTRTASERYGKARTGTKRAKKMFRIDPQRLALVQSNARTYTPKAERKNSAGNSLAMS